MMGDKIKLVSLNVRGLQEKQKRREIFHFFTDKGADIVFVQESHSHIKDIQFWEQEWGGKIIASHGETNARGSMIMINKKMKKHAKILKNQTCKEGRWVICDLKIETKILTLVNIYGPNNDNEEYWLNILNELRNFECTHIIMGGDYNFVMNQDYDCINREPTHKKCKTIVEKINEELDLVDIWRSMNPEKKIFTWQRYIKKREGKQLVGSRLDYLFVNTGIVTNVEKAEIQYGYKTDHSMVSITIKLNNFIRGPGVWKLNNELLEIEEYRDYIHDIITDHRKSYEYMKGIKAWEFLKRELIECSKNYAKQRAMKNKSNKTKVMELLEIIQKEIQINSLEELMNVKLDVEACLEQIKIQETRKHIFLSQCKWAREGELPTSYFLSLEKRNYLAKNMTCLETDSGQLINQQRQIMKEQQKFYECLYTSNKEIVFGLGEENIPSRVTEMDNKNLCEPITKEELLKNLKDMRPNKTPGCDGLTREFYLCFFENLSDFIMSLYDEVLTNKELNPSARKGLITLLPKKSKNLRKLKSWRPLTLLSIDYKLLARIYAERLKKVLPQIISPEQTGFMENRDICENLRRMLETIEYANKTKKDGLIISIDFEKCFDRVEHKAVLGSLRFFGICEEFVQYIKIFFTNFYVSTQHHGFLSNTFLKSRGVNQGCPISPFCYLVMGELITLMIQQNRNIKGINISDKIKNILAQFADDTALFIQYDKISLCEVVETFSRIEACTGLKISYDKTIIYRIGSISNTDAKLYTQKNFNWTKEPFSFLGITVSDSTECARQTYLEIIEKLENQCNAWGDRKLTLMGKVQVVNSLMESLFVYKINAFTNIPEDLCKKI